MFLFFFNGLSRFDGIGRRAGFRYQCRKACRFESYSRQHIESLVSILGTHSRSTLSSIGLERRSSKP